MHLSFVFFLFCLFVCFSKLSPGVLADPEPFVLINVVLFFWLTHFCSDVK